MLPENYSAQESLAASGRSLISNPCLYLILLIFLCRQKGAAYCGGPLHLSTPILFVETVGYTLGSDAVNCLASIFFFEYPCLRWQLFSMNRSMAEREPSVECSRFSWKHPRRTSAAAGPPQRRGWADSKQHSPECLGRFAGQLKLTDAPPGDTGRSPPFPRDSLAVPFEFCLGLPNVLSARCRGPVCPVRPDGCCCYTLPSGRERDEVNG